MTWQLGLQDRIVPGERDCRFPRQMQKIVILDPQDKITVKRIKTRWDYENGDVFLMYGSVIKGNFEYPFFYSGDDAAANNPIKYDLEKHFNLCAQ